MSLLDFQIMSVLKTLERCEIAEVSSVEEVVDNQRK